MNTNRVIVLLFICVLAGLLGTRWMAMRHPATTPTPPDREEIVFWHFWGGEDRDVVEQFVDRFNRSQRRYYVRAIAMPGNNFDAKLYLSITGGDPPDLVNQDDPIVADWAYRGAILPFDEWVPENELADVQANLFPAAKQLGTYDNRLFAICNGLDIRALYYNKTILDQYGLQPPQTIAELDHIARTIAPPDEAIERRFYGYLPDSRRLWAWGYVFGGQFFDAESGRVTCDSVEISATLNWMTQYSRWYGADTISAFRQGDQSLPGKRFPLLPLTDDAMVGRYALVMDGQWRTRDIEALLEQRKERNLPAPEFGVCPLPYPDGGRANAGWVNGNFFVVPRGARNQAGAWEFIKFWIGMDQPELAAEFCAMGGWIPPTYTVSQSNLFQRHLEQHPLVRPFMELASSDNQFPIPVVPGAPLFRRTIEQTAAEAFNQPDRVSELLEKARRVIQTHLDRSNPERQ